MHHHGRSFSERAFGVEQFLGLLGGKGAFLLLKSPWPEGANGLFAAILFRYHLEQGIEVVYHALLGEGAENSHVDAASSVIRRAVWRP